MAPTATKEYTIVGKNGFDSLKWNESSEIPKLGDHDVLVNIHYVALNYRDLIIPMGKYTLPSKDGVIPCSDGAGTVIDIGARVTHFKRKDHVMAIFNQSHQAGLVTVADVQTGIGGAVNGTLRQYGVFEETGLVKMPESLSFKEASTLPCAAVTAWNALYGLEGRALKPGDWVLTQGTGGVSMFAVQFAKAAGARVIATTSSDEKAKTLKSHGVDHVINYRSTPNWGEEAKKLTTGGLGVGHILEVGGPKTMAQSLNAAKPEGVISIIGFLGGVKEPNQPGFLECLSKLVIVRGVIVGSRLQFEDMNAAIDATNLKPIIDKTEFAFEQAKEAYQYMWEQKHFGKVVIKVSDEEAASKL